MPDLKVISIVNKMPQPRGDLSIPLNSDGTFAGNPLFVNGSDRAVQDVIRGLLTRLGSNFLAPNFGTILKTLLHSRSVTGVADSISSEIQKMLGYLGQFTSTEIKSEQIVELTNLKATQSSDTITVDMTVRTGTGATSTVTIQ